MDTELKQRIELLEKKMDLILTESISAKKHAKVSLYITVAVIVLPIIGLLFAIPSFLSTYSEYDSMLNGL